MLTNLTMVLLTPKALPPLAWGSPGVGKSSRVYKLAEAFKAHVEVVIASLREPTDFFGLQIPVEGNGLKVEPPGWAVRAKNAMNKGQKALVFHDEVSQAPPAVQGALMRVILEGVVGELKMDGVMQVAVANPPDQAAGGWDLALPMANRFTHLKWPAPSGKEWTDWLLGNSPDEADVTSLVARFDLAEWEKAFERSKALFSGFIKRFPEALNEDPSKVAGRFPLAYATPRTMENAVRLYATCLHLDRLDRAQVLLEGSVGDSIATKFLAWVRDADLPDPEDLLRDPSLWKPDPNRDDRTFAVLGGVAAAATDKKYKDDKYLKRWVNAWKVVDKTIKTGGKDLVVIGCRKLAAKENRPKDGLRDQGVRDTVTKLADVIKASGLLEE